MIVATAGHVDHGKSTLVAALTGERTDRLPEEQRRGMTIEAGYSHADLGDGRVVDFVDLPGHERYLRHLLAGIAAADVALLVVAADDGPMPQTHEHLALLRALHRPRIVPVLTKGDRTGADRRAEVRDALRRALAAQGIEGAETFEVCAPRGEGLEALRSHLRTLHDALPPPGAADAVRGAFRLAVDRLFVRGGVGLVATGTVLSGCVEVGAELVAMPSGGTLRVRALQMHGRAVAQAAAGQRCALNVAPRAGERVALERGDWLVAPPRAVPTRRLDVDWHPVPAPGASPGGRIEVLPAAREAALRTSLQLHLGNAVRQARLIQIASHDAGRADGRDDRTALGPQRGAEGDAGGGTEGRSEGSLQGRPPDRAADVARHGTGEGHGGRAGEVAPRFAQLLLDRPVIALHGDRFVLREPASRRLLGGGVVLDASPPARGRARPQRLAELQALCEATPAQALAGLLSARRDGVEARAFALNWDLAPDALEALAAQADAVRIAHPAGLRLVAPRAWQSLLDEVPRQLAQAHRDQPASRGLSDDAVHRTLAAHGDAPLRRAALEHLRRAGVIERDGFVWRLPGHVARLAEADAVLLQRVTAIMQPHGLRPPPLGDLAALLEQPLPEAAAFLERAAALGHLVQIAKNRFFLPATLQALAEVARETAAAAPDGRFEVIPFRDRSGIGRNLSIQVLEYFDRMRITRFVGERRSMVDR